MPRRADRLLSFDPGEIQQWTQTAEPWQAAAFMAACVARMLPNYERFVDETGFGDVDASREAVDVAWRWAELGFADDWDRMKLRCESNAPDTAEYASRYTSAALDASVAAALMLEFLQTGRMQIAVEIASLARDTVDLWVQEARNLDPSTPDFEEKIRVDPLMQSELKAQALDRSELASGAAARPELVRRIRQRAVDRRDGSLGHIDG